MMKKIFAVFAVMVLSSNEAAEMISQSSGSSLNSIVDSHRSSSFLSILLERQSTSQTSLAQTIRKSLDSLLFVPACERPLVRAVLDVCDLINYDPNNNNNPVQPKEHTVCSEFSSADPSGTLLFPANANVANKRCAFAIVASSPNKLVQLDCSIKEWRSDFLLESHKLLNYLAFDPPPFIVNLADSFNSNGLKASVTRKLGMQVHYRATDGTLQDNLKCTWKVLD